MGEKSLSTTTEGHKDLFIIISL